MHEELSRLKAQLERWNAEAEAWEARVRALRLELLAQRELSAAGLEEMARAYDAAWRVLRAAFDQACEPGRIAARRSRALGRSERQRVRAKSPSVVKR